MAALNPTTATRPAAVLGPLQRYVGRLYPKREGVSMLTFFGRLLCRHTHGRLIGIEFDGTAVYECAACGKHVEKPL